MEWSNWEPNVIDNAAGGAQAPPTFQAFLGQGGNDIRRENPHYTLFPPNGRVIGLDKPQGILQQFIPNDTDANPTLKGTLGNITERTPLSDLFFSDLNQNLLQDAIRYEVWKQSNGKFVVGRQSDTELSLVMRAMFFQYAKFLPTDYNGQIRELNKYVIDHCVPIILTNVKQYEGYLYDVQHQPTPIPLAQNVSNKGSRVLPSVTTTFPETGTLPPAFGGQ